MSPPTRRALLSVLAPVAASLAGCFETPGRTTPTRTTGTEAARTPNPDRNLVFDPVEPDEASTATVYPERLRTWLREAARTGDTLRVHARTPVYVPRPVLSAYRRVRLASPGPEVAGTYELDVTGGARYELHVGATPVEEVPADAVVTPVSSLPDARRRLAEDAIRDLGRVYPETELGEWTRREFFDGYVSHDDTTYRGHEIPQTDAGFFSTTVWCVLSLSETAVGGDPPPVTLRLPAIPEAVRQPIDHAFERRDTADEDTSVALDETTDPDALSRFADETEHLLAHIAVFDVSVVEPGEG